MANLEYTWKKTLIASIILFGLYSIAHADIVNKLPTGDNTIALTFDACETKTPSYFDEGILNYLIKDKIPFTLFVSGKFAERNRERLGAISKYDFIEIENHSLNHHQHLEKLPQETIRKEVVDNERLIQEIAGRRPVFFRFPGGNYDSGTLHLVETLGYKVVHWSFPSGDPDKSISADKLTNWVLSSTKKGSILIFHINGRGYRTGEALPRIVAQLRSKGYQFVRLDELLRPNERFTPRQ